MNTELNLSGDAALVDTVLRFQISVNHFLIMKKFHALGYLPHDFPNLLTLDWRRAVFDKVGWNEILIFPTMNVVVKVQLAEFHIDENILRNLSDLYHCYNVRMAPVFVEALDSFDFIFDDLCVDAGDVNQFPRKILPTLIPFDGMEGQLF